MKINIHGPTNQKPHLFSSCRLELRACVSFCSFENYSWSKCNGDADMMRGGAYGLRDTARLNLGPASY